MTKTEKTERFQLDEAESIKEIEYILFSRFGSYELLCRITRIFRHLYLVTRIHDIEKAISKYPRAENELKIIYSSSNYLKILDDQIFYLMSQVSRDGRIPYMIAEGYILAIEICKNDIVKYNLLRKVICLDGSMDKWLDQNKTRINFKKPIVPLTDSPNTDWVRVLRKDLKRVMTAVPGEKVPKNFNSSKHTKKMANAIEKFSIPKSLKYFKALYPIESLAELKLKIDSKKKLSYSNDFEQILQIFTGDEENLTLVKISEIESKLDIESDIFEENELV